MGNNIFLTALILPLILLAGCIEDGGGDDGGGDGTSEGIAFDVCFVPRPFAAGTGTRVATDAAFSSTWEVGDRIGLFAVEADSPLAPSDNYIHNVKLTLTESGKWSLDPGTEIIWPRGGCSLDFYAYHPYDEAATDPTDISFSVETDQNDFTDGRANFNLSDLLTARTAGRSRGDGAVPLAFKHALALVQVTVDDAAELLGPIPGGDMTVRLQGVRAGATLDLDGAGSSPGDPTVTLAGETTDAVGIDMYRVTDAEGYVFRALVPAQTLASSSRIFSIAGGDARLVSSRLTSDITLTASETEKFIQRTAYRVPEANSYMVAPNGDPILIPAVARANSAGTTDGLGGILDGDELTVVFVWDDVASRACIKEMRVVGQNIYLVPGAAGNTLIGLRVGNVLKWSWHIWVTQTVDEHHDSGSGFTWMDRNLGASSKGSIDNQNGIFYQWGRKDPFRYTGTATGNDTAMANLVKNPTSFSTNLGYAGAAGADSWGGPTGAKTIHDPCPPGWKVPPISYTVKIDNVTNTINIWGGNWIPQGKGYVFKGSDNLLTVSYNPTGYLDQNDRLLNNGTTTGYHWSSMRVVGSPNAYFMKFDGTRVTHNTSNSPRFGFAVRCIREQTTKQWPTRDS
jgi:hypothetical protein